MAYSNSRERPIIYQTQSLLSPLDNEAPQKTIVIPQDGGQIRSLHAADYHYGALTTDGRLYTFGGWLRGGLGLGDPFLMPPGSPGGYETEQLRKEQLREYGISPPPVWQPTEVVFGDPRGGRKGRRTFVHQVAFGGWHSACSAVDLGVCLLFKSRSTKFYSLLLRLIISKMGFYSHLTRIGQLKMSKILRETHPLSFLASLGIWSKGLEEREPYNLHRCIIPPIPPSLPRPRLSP
jgi:hypothetical protein